MYNDRCKKANSQEIFKSKGVFIMNENQAEIKAQAVETEMKKYFGSLVSDFNLIDAFCGN